MAIFRDKTKVGNRCTKSITWPSQVYTLFIVQKRKRNLILKCRMEENEITDHCRRGMECRKRAPQLSRVVWGLVRLYYSVGRTPGHHAPWCSPPELYSESETTFWKWNNILKVKQHFKSETTFWKGNTRLHRTCPKWKIHLAIPNTNNRYSRTPDERPPSPTTIPLIWPHFVWRTVVSVRIRIPHERPSLLYDHTNVLVRVVV